MPRFAYEKDLTKMGAEPLDGSGFESEEPETQEPAGDEAESEVSE